MGSQRTRRGHRRTTMPVMTALVQNITAQTDEALLAEHAYISACIEEGFWHPLTDGLTVADFPASEEVYKSISRYAARSGGLMPPLAHVQRLWPEVVFVPGCSRSWAVAMLLEESRSKQVAIALRHSLKELKEGRIDRALQIMREGARDAGTALRAGILLHEIEEEDASDRLPSLYPAIDACGGIGAGDYVLVLARTNVGKSYRLMQHAQACVEQGRNVLYLSLEMRRARCATRLHQLLFKDQWSLLPWQEKQYKAQEWSEAAGGSFRLIDDSEGIVNAENIARWSKPGDVVFVDYMGLMRNSKGQRMTEDWRVAAEISNSLRSLTTEVGITVFAGAQANRATGNNNAPDDMSIAQTDAIGQDIDLGISLTRKTKDLPFTINTVFKARSGSMAEGKWFTQFNPSSGDFSEISPERAWELSNEHDAREGLVL